MPNSHSGGARSVPRNRARDSAKRLFGDARSNRDQQATFGLGFHESVAVGDENQFCHDAAERHESQPFSFHGAIHDRIIRFPEFVSSMQLEPGETSRIPGPVVDRDHGNGAVPPGLRQSKGRRLHVFAINLCWGIGSSGGAVQSIVCTV